MTRGISRALAVLAAAGLVAAGMVSPASAAGNDLARRGFSELCPAKSGNVAHCLSWFKRGAAKLAAPDGVGATDLRSAYKLPASPPPGSTVAIAIAYHAPNLEADLATYRSEYGLPPCTAASGCLTVVNQDGNAAPLPENVSGWDIEESLDVQMVSAGCPTCNIVVVEAKTPRLDDLSAAVRTAGKRALVISNSYGLDEWGGVQPYVAVYEQPGHAVVVSSGDAGFTTASFPATVGSVIAVGGTVLTPADNPRGFDETTWVDGGSGCSAYVAKPARQHDPNCGMRTTSDVSAAADNIAIFVSAYGGWGIVAGTSASAPFIAGLYGQTHSGATADKLYQHPEAFFDITTGTNDRFGGDKCGNDYLCVAQPGYDAPTGVGSPNGLGGF